jgi:multidrug efflux pump subunit AcrB
LNSSNAGEFTFTLFVVIGISLLLSWIVAVLFSPIIGVTLLPKTLKKHDEKPRRLMGAFSRLLAASMRRRWLTISLGLALFLLSLIGLKLCNNNSSLPPTGQSSSSTSPCRKSSIAATKAQMDRFESKLIGDNDVDHWSSYVGQGAVRFVLSFDVQMPNPNYGQMIIVTRTWPRATGCSPV